ncbi:MAG: DEAD/DEAH box helicase, partial [Aeromonas sp.]
MMMMRPYQQDAIDQVYSQWSSGKRAVMLVMPTGAGKAAVLCEIARLEAARGQHVLITAHRKELITQLSNTLARNGVTHNIISTKERIKYAVRLHMEDHGRQYYDPNSKVTVASVQSVNDNHLKRFIPLHNRLTLIGDEGHHYTRESQTWGKVFTPLDANGASILLLTATPCRADGKGLSRGTDGYADTLVEGPNMRACIEMGFLVDYKIFCPPTDLHLENVRTSQTTGDYMDSDLKKEIGRSHIIGDIVEHYLRFTPGKRGVTFTVGVDMAREVTQQYIDRGVPAITVHGGMKDNERIQALRDLRTGKVLQVVNDSVLTEGTDEPSIEVVTFARPTESFALYSQMFGRGTRLSPDTGKTHLTVIDAVGNVLRHGLPDAYREWSLDRREKRSSGKSDAPPLRICTECSQPFERFRKVCPYCGAEIPAPAERSGPEYVDGDLFELDPATLAQMRADVARVDMSPQDYHAQLSAQGVPQIGIMANVKRHIVRQGVVGELRDVLAHWAGAQRAAGLSDGEIYR